MTKKSSSNSGGKESSTSGDFLKPIPKCNDYLHHEFKKWVIPSLENLQHDKDSGINAAYAYLTGYRRLVDPVAEPTPRKWYAFLLLAFLAGAAACLYAFVM